MSEVLITVPEAANKLGMTYRQLYDSMLAGVVCGVREGSRWLVRAEDVDRLAKDRQAMHRRGDSPHRPGQIRNGK